MIIRKALIEYPANQGRHERFLLRDTSDMLAYRDYCNKDSDSFIKRLIKSDLPVNRWDHVFVESPAGTSLLTAVNMCKLKGGRPLFEYAQQFDARLNRLASYIDADQPVVVNNSGGYFPLDSEDMVIKEYMWTPKRIYMHTLNKGSTHIALENDSRMEPDAHDELLSIDASYSSILDLRSYSPDELENILCDFKKQGGHTVYVYTTGLDLSQMEKYINAVYSSGLRSMMFNFVGDDTDRLLFFSRSVHSEMEIELSPECAKYTN